MPAQDWKMLIQQWSVSAQKNFFWLRTLSYLEYIGYRKMVKTLKYHRVQNEEFHHLSDEIRHSYLLKSLAQRLYPNFDLEPSQESKLQNISEDYFQGLDQCTYHWIEKQLGKADPYLNYLLVSFVIEKRVMQVYPFYAKQIKNDKFQQTLQSIIHDENEHLKHLEIKVKKAKKYSELELNSLIDEEKQYFDNFFSQISDFLKTEPVVNSL